jgi:putative addiction module component (TIGR02574 family)
LGVHDLLGPWWRGAWGVAGSPTRCDDQHVINLKIDAKQLSAEERLKLIEQLWDSLEADDVPVTAAQRAELDRRIEEMDRDAKRGIPWKDVLDRIRGRAK